MTSTLKPASNSKLPLPVPEQYNTLLKQKVQRVLELFQGIPLPAYTVVESEPEYYRMRAEFRIWHEADSLDYAMYAPEDPKTPIPLDQFPVASKAINELMPKVKLAVQGSELLRKRLFQIEFLSTLSDDMLITLIYHRRLEDDWHAAAQELEQQLGCKIIGRSRKQKRVVSDDFVLETLCVDNQPYHYRQYEGGFTQPNAKINEHMISWACQQIKDCEGDLLELYCGNGNFTIPFSRFFPKVFATEISKTSVKALSENCALNKAGNIQLARLSAEELSEALRGERQFRRLKDIDLSAFNLQTVFVDPPRAGLDEATRKTLADFPQILYISCNPDTLQRDIRALENFEVAAFAFFDQFPYTDHMECGCLLKAKTN